MGTYLDISEVCLYPISKVSVLVTTCPHPFPASRTLLNSLTKIAKEKISMKQCYKLYNE